MKKLILSFVTGLLSLTATAQNPGKSLLNPGNHALVLIDHEGQMAFATKSISMEELRNNVALVAGGSKIFNVPTVVTTVAEKSFSGPVFPEISAVYPEATSGYVDRTTMNTWEDLNAHKAITGKNKKKLVFAGLWTSVCIVGPVLSAIDEGYDVYVVTDASGDISKEAHDQSVTRMVQAGAHPITSVQYVLELQRDWARKETYKPVNDLMKKYGGAYGIGIQYAQEMLKH
ncbi:MULTISPECIES: hydrolase [Chryseobacterium]|jgi:Amidases related to nicotinamidase|uniref:Hydrolase n=1 Tax=Chryseobacterium rhizosphaerae TaxID=395937 RepID=A0AAE3YEX2_9FLAO|nr:MULTISPECIES: hydrolase [Chryseobacterium]MBL3547192.1 hydrolase [Chryseobacterium sp. KMC2]MDC8099359.1 hydrolase [Chryseobacterium rhizosphaerae]MDR6528821.1 nicotinamidase-related amidase [Chryseobacterium rhizosphaerae]MDR6546196.1 nicotinamidase-related amidase [Chryseobacterium rhizosphaerae]REC76893.1 hydrolase [Chryseobacterium rhizosphaerae]